MGPAWRDGSPTALGTDGCTLAWVVVAAAGCAAGAGLAAVSPASGSTASLVVAAGAATSRCTSMRPSSATSSPSAAKA